MDLLPTTSSPFLACSGLVALALGLIALASGSLGIVRAARSDAPDPGRALGLARAARVAILGLAVSGVGVGLVFELSWLWGVSLIVLGEEALECTVHVLTLRAGARS